MKTVGKEKAVLTHRRLLRDGLAAVSESTAVQLTYEIYRHISRQDRNDIISDVCGNRVRRGDASLSAHAPLLRRLRIGIFGYPVVKDPYIERTS